jgi:hypothetical protein
MNCIYERLKGSVVHGFDYFLNRLLQEGKVIAQIKNSVCYVTVLVPAICKRVLEKRRVPDALFDTRLFKYFMIITYSAFPDREHLAINNRAEPKAILLVHNGYNTSRKR